MADLPRSSERLDRAVAQLDGAELSRVLALAAATTRVDRKYVVGLDVATELVGLLAPDHHCLEIAGRRSTTYLSTYHDTATLGTARAHQQGRRRRYKLRTRLYVEDGLCRHEVKVRDGSGRTTKHLAPAAAYGVLDDAAVAFVTGALDDHGFPSPGPVGPTAEVGYTRTTLVDLVHGLRVTVDRDLWARNAGRTVRLAPHLCVVETKGGRTAALADRALLALGERPRQFSKYLSVMALTDERVRDNDVRRLVGDVLMIDDQHTLEESA